MANGAEDGATIRANREGFAHYQIRARRLVDVSKTDMSLTLFGKTWETPIFLCPVSGHRIYDPQGELATPMVNQFLRFGASPRAAQALVLAGKVKALLDGRANVSIDDIRSTVLPAMRHRCLLNFEGEAEGMKTDAVLQNVVDTLPMEAAAVAA